MDERCRLHRLIVSLSPALFLKPHGLKADLEPGGKCAEWKETPDTT